MTPQISGFEVHDVPLAAGRLRLATGGAGPPVLLLHGFPQTHIAWRAVAPRLAERFRVVCPDLPGYGASAPAVSYAKRTTAATMVALMRELGHERFAVVGHDRGALVAFRAALDHPDVVQRLAVLDVIPTVDMWAALHGPAGVFAFHLYLLAHPTDLPERMIAADPDTFFGHLLDIWTRHPAGIPADVRAAYLAACRTPEAVHAICEDYRASATVDVEHDTQDRNTHARIGVPVLAMWQDPRGIALPFDPAEVWSRWAPDLRTRVLPGGHFLPEDCPNDVAAAIAELVAG